MLSHQVAIRPVNLVLRSRFGQLTLKMTCVYLPSDFVCLVGTSTFMSASAPIGQYNPARSAGPRNFSFAQYFDRQVDTHDSDVAVP
mgnify:CR=1 FL=1